MIKVIKKQKLLEFTKKIQIENKFEPTCSICLKDFSYGEKLLIL